MALDVELSETRDFLAHHHPFDTLPAAVLDRLPGLMTVRYFRRGTKLIAKGRDNHHLYVLRSGAADVHDEQGSLVDRGGAGACFGSITLTRGNPSTMDVTAIEDSLALLLPAEDFHRLCAEHPEVDAFFDAQRASRMRGAVDSLQLVVDGGARSSRPGCATSWAGSRWPWPRPRPSGTPPGSCRSTGSPRSSSWTGSGSPASSPTVTCAPASSPQEWTRRWGWPR